VATEFKLPQLGEQVEKGIVLSVLVSEGDHVDADDVVLELETDKATTEVPAPSAGTVGELRVHEGDEIQSGDVIMMLEEDGGEEKEGQESEAGDREPEPEDSGREPESEPEDGGREPESESEPEDGGREPEPEDGDREPEPEPEAGGREEEPEPEPEAKRRSRSGDRERERKQPRERERPKIGEPVPASPSVRRFARELGVELSMIAGTGDGGRVTEEDIKSHVRNLLEDVSREKQEREDELPDFSQWGEVEREPMNAIRRATADNVSRSWEKIPHVTQYDDADVTDLENFRSRFAEEAEEEGGKLTVTAILVKVAAIALERFPDFNASVDVERGELVRKKYVSIGVAVDTEEGLLVPVLRDVDDKGLVQIAAELGEKAGKARARKLSREDMQGGTFSITNLGGLGTTRFTPIVGWPQVAILSVGRMETKPVWNGDEFEPRKILPLGITYDHRAVDGADAAKFLRWIAETLENPMRLTMEA
jgi:pyruvate dehydrogenase E2 component (dihydrolipoamide acetyltransferase)